MNEGLDRLLNLIEKSLSLNTPEEIREIEQNIQIEFQKLRQIFQINLKIIK